MVGNHAVAGPRGVGLRLFGQVDRRGDQRLEQVDIIIVMHALQHSRRALQPHAGIDRGLGQFSDDLGFFLPILHENQVPDLDETVTIFLRRAGWAAPDMIAMIVEQFAARAAGAIVAHRPEIVLGGDTDDAVFRKTGNLAPQIISLIVIMIDGGRQPGGVDAPFLGDQRPGMFDRLFLEIVAEREIAHHLEKGVVAGGVAHIIEIIMLAAGTDALLRAGGGDIGPRFQARKNILERHHACVNKHKCRVIMGNERR